MVSLPPCVWEIRTAIPFYVSFDVSLSNSQALHALSYKRNFVRTYTRSVFLHVSGIKKNCSDIRTRHLRGFFLDILTLCKKDSLNFLDREQARRPEFPSGKFFLAVYFSTCMKLRFYATSRDLQDCFSRGELKNLHQNFIWHKSSFKSFPGIYPFAQKGVLPNHLYFASLRVFIYLN